MIHKHIPLVFTVVAAAPFQAFALPCDPPDKIEIIESINAPVAQVWEYWTTANGVKGFFAPDSEIDAHLGGVYSIYFAPSQPPGMRGADNMRISHFEPHKSLSFTWNAPGYFGELRDELTEVSITFEPTENNTTRLYFRHDGFGEGEKWDLMRFYFSRGWQSILWRLQRLASGVPTDWSDPSRGIPGYFQSAQNLEELYEQCSAYSVSSGKYENDAINPSVAGDLPKFLTMYGEWESRAIRSEPEHYLASHPEMKIPHRIFGRPLPNGEGIIFVSEQAIKPGATATDIIYVYDRELNKSYGLLSSSDGVVWRGILHHGDEFDTLELLDGSGEIVWREQNKWRLDSSFQSRAIVNEEGLEVVIWYDTRRIE